MCEKSNSEKRVKNINNPNKNVKNISDPNKGNNKKLIFSFDKFHLNSINIQGEYNNNYGNRNKKISESISGEKHFMYGKHHTESTKNKLRVAFSGVNNPMYGMKGDKSPVAKKS